LSRQNPGRQSDHHQRGVASAFAADQNTNVLTGGDEVILHLLIVKPPPPSPFEAMLNGIGETAFH